VKKPGNNIPFDFIDEAQRKNRDGYGVSWVEDGAVQTFKTLDYEEYKTKLTELEDKLIVVHLRATSAGTTCIDNVHPFTVPTGVMFHNGTISGLKSTGTTDSDTNILAQLISKTKFNKVTDIAPLLYAITGTTYNKLVFLNKDNTVSYINKNLGIDDPNGNWYSNNYHVKEEIYNVFVYGTLKHGFSNHFYYMTDSDYVDDAFTLEKHAMIGKIHRPILKLRKIPIISQNISIP
jgi:predicted glutamine amidotransferase